MKTQPTTPPNAAQHCIFQMSVVHHKPSTLGDWQQQAFELLLDYEQRAQQQARGRQAQDQQQTWFGLQILLGEQLLLLPQSQLAEVITSPTVTPIPGTPPWMLGLCNHYGQLIPVIDLYGFIYGKRWPLNSQRRVLLSDSEPPLGFLVSELKQTMRCPTPSACTDQLQLDVNLNRWVKQSSQLGSQTLPILELGPIIEAASHWKRH